MHHRSSRLSTILMFTLALGVSGCAQPEADVASFSAQDAAAVRTNLDTFMSADPIDAPDTFFSQFSEDVYWVRNDQEPWVGMQALRSVDWCHTLSGTNITADHVAGSGGLAYARGTYLLSLRCGNDTVNSQGDFLSIHRRQQDGSWRIEAMQQRE